MLTGSEILEERAKGNIIIEPFKHENLGPNSYDLTLGPWIIRYKSYGKQSRITINVTNEEHIREVFALPEYCKESILLRPHERILCHTNEIAGTRDKFIPEVDSRSTLKRWGIDACGSAGYGDIGFANIWTLELKNDTDQSIVIPVGVSFVQIYFTRADGEIGTIYKGVYNNLSRLRENWKPEHMLPKVM